MLELIAFAALIGAVVSKDGHGELSVRERLEQVTEEILDRMQSEGWYYGPSREPRYDRPTAWHINCGWCQEWADLARGRVGGEIVDVDWELDTGGEYMTYCHDVLKLEGRFYDSQHPEGVDDLRKLDLVCKVSLEDFLSRQESS
jgi:hypothetical protein